MVVMEIQNFAVKNVWKRYQPDGYSLTETVGLISNNSPYIIPNTT